MKKLMGFLVIIAVVILGSYYGMGIATEHTLKKSLEVVNQSNGLFVEVDQYNRGWFTSAAVLNWRLHVPERVIKDQAGQPTTIAAQDFTLQMPLEIYHGPFIFANSNIKFGLGYAHSDLAMPEAFLEKFSNLFKDESVKPKLSLNLFVNYLNQSQLHLRMPMFQLFAKQGDLQFKWDGMDSYVSISSNMQTIDGNFTIDGASLTQEKLEATLGKVSSDYSLHQTEAGLYLGDASLTMPSLVVLENKQNVIDVDQFELHSSSDVKEGLFSSSFQTKLNKVAIKEKTFGPALLEISIKNLDAKVLADINEQANKMQQGPESMRQQALLALLPELPKLFSQGAQFEISKFSLVMPQGPIEGQMLISLPKGDAGNPFQLLQKVQGGGSLKVPASVLKGLMVSSVQQKLLQQSALQQAVVQQMKNDGVAAPTPVPVVEKAAEAPAAQGADGSASAPQSANAAIANVPSGGAAAAAQASQPQSQPTSAADVESQAIAQADEKLAAMVQSGLLSLRGTEYVVEVSLTQGQLTVNGNPFNPAMVQF